MNEEKEVLYEENPAVFRGNLTLTIVGFVGIAAVGLGLLLLLGMWIKSKQTKLLITQDYISVKKGILSRNTNEIPISSVTNIKTKQGVLDRLFNIGSITISSSATAGEEIILNNFEAPIEIKNIIRHYRKSDSRSSVQTPKLNH